MQPRAPSGATADDTEENPAPFFAGIVLGAFCAFMWVGLIWAALVILP